MRYSARHTGRATIDYSGASQTAEYKPTPLLELVKGLALFTLVGPPIGGSLFILAALAPALVRGFADGGKSAVVLLDVIAASYFFGAIPAAMTGLTAGALRGNGRLRTWRQTLGVAATGGVFSALFFLFMAHPFPETWRFYGLKDFVGKLILLEAVPGFVASLCCGIMFRNRTRMDLSADRALPAHDEPRQDDPTQRAKSPRGVLRRFGGLRTERSAPARTVAEAGVCSLPPIKGMTIFVLLWPAIGAAVFFLMGSIELVIQGYGVVDHGGARIMDLFVNSYFRGAIPAALIGLLAGILRDRGRLRTVLQCSYVAILGAVIAELFSFARLFVGESWIIFMWRSHVLALITNGVVPGFVATLCCALLFRERIKPASTPSSN